MRRRLVRDYIHDCLYSRGKGYFAQQNVIHSPTVPLEFTSLLGGFDHTTTRCPLLLVPLHPYCAASACM
jgi:hypothetical protein